MGIRFKALTLIAATVHSTENHDCAWWSSQSDKGSRTTSSATSRDVPWLPAGVQSLVPGGEKLKSVVIVGLS